MNDAETEIDVQDLKVPRWVQVPAGLLLGACTLLCLAGSATLMFAPPEKARVLGPALGTVMTVSCLWLLAKCARLITGRKVHGGLMGPGAFRVVGWFFLLLPVAGLFTGYFTDNPTGALLQTAANVATFTGLRALARIREQASGG